MGSPTTSSSPSPSTSPRSARRRQTSATLAAGIEALCDELRLFTARLEAAGLHVDPPLSPVEITTATRTRSHPTNAPITRTQLWSLASAVGISAGDLAPMVVAEDFAHVQIDGSIHRSYWIEAWPRLDVPAAWMDLVLLGIHGTRTINIVFEPVAPSAAARAIDEAAIALETAEATKAKHGFRIRAADRRKRDEVEQREHELVAGHGDLAYAGFFHVTATDLDSLDDLAADAEQTAAHAGVLLRPLDGRHGAAWAASLPLGRTLAQRKVAP
ncbi:MAG: SCO6880 family protein [Ilumatobacteraceae bacterium]